VEVCCASDEVVVIVMSICILDMPPHCRLTLNGAARVTGQSFVGISLLPPTKKGSVAGSLGRSAPFHFITLAAPPESSQGGQRGEDGEVREGAGPSGAPCVTTGFFFRSNQAENDGASSSSSDMMDVDSNNSSSTAPEEEGRARFPVTIRHFNKQTREMSASCELSDEARSNFEMRMKRGELGTCLASYDDFINGSDDANSHGPADSSNTSSNSSARFALLMSFVTETTLHSAQLAINEKIIPGCFADDDDELQLSTAIIDGIAPQWKPVPLPVSVKNAGAITHG
jgi:hypothetical protein